MLKGFISVGHFHDMQTGHQRVGGGEVDLRKVPVILWDAEREIGHCKSTKTGITVDDNQARIELEGW